MCHNRFTTSPLPVPQVFLHPADSLQGRQPPARGTGHLRGDRAGLGSSQDQTISYRNSALQHMQIHSDSKFTSSKKRSSQPDRGKIKSVNIYTAETVFLGLFAPPGQEGFIVSRNASAQGRVPTHKPIVSEFPPSCFGVQYLPRDTLSPCEKKRSRQETI